MFKKNLKKLFIEKKKQKYENERARNREIIEYQICRERERERQNCKHERSLKARKKGRKNIKERE